MDPQATWNEILEEIAAGNLDEAGIRAEALLEWLDCGGFVPQTTSRLLPAEWDRRLCRFLCRRVILSAQHRE